MSSMHLTVNDEGKVKCGAVSWGYGPGVYATKEVEKVTCSRCKGTVRRTVTSGSFEGNWKGKIFHTSFGYDMTINRYAMVVKQNAKSVLVRECGAIVKDDNGCGAGNATCGEPDMSSKPFLIFKKMRDYGNGRPPSESYVGDGTWWTEWDGKKNYHNTWD